MSCETDDIGGLSSGKEDNEAGQETDCKICCFLRGLTITVDSRVNKTAQEVIPAHTLSDKEALNRTSSASVIKNT